LHFEWDFRLEWHVSPAYIWNCGLERLTEVKGFVYRRDYMLEGSSNWVAVRMVNSNLGTFQLVFIPWSAH